MQHLLGSADSTTMAAQHLPSWEVLYFDAPNRGEQVRGSAQHLPCWEVALTVASRYELLSPGRAGTRNSSLSTPCAPRLTLRYEELLSFDAPARHGAPLLATTPLLRNSPCALASRYELLSPWRAGMRCSHRGEQVRVALTVASRYCSHRGEQVRVALTVASRSCSHRGEQELLSPWRAGTSCSHPLPCR